MLNTGNGKGKSSSAFGVVARALGHGMKVAVIQFVKGRTDTGEEAFFKRAAAATGERLSWHVTGEGFTWEIQDDARDVAAAKAAWALASLSDATTELVVPCPRLSVLGSMRRPKWQATSAISAPNTAPLPTPM